MSLMPALPANIDPNKARLPATYEQAKQALATCDRLDECKDIADKAEALASYARQAQDTELREMADRIQARAVRRCGELLNEIKPASKSNLKQNRGRRDGTVPSGKTRTKAATDAGLSERQRKTALRVAAVPPEEFEKAIDGPNPPSVTALAERGTKHAATEAGLTAKPMTPDEILARDVGRMTYTLNMFVGLVEHVSPEQFVERADSDAVANAKTAAAWLAWLADLPSEPQSRSWRNLAPIGSLLKGRK